MKEVKRAVIPAAGQGTRMQPVSLVLPKELLPVGMRPMIQFALEEAIEAGLHQVAIVINRKKELIRDYFDRLGKCDPFNTVSIHYLYQEEAAGLADAVDQCRDWLQGEPFGLLLPDNVPGSPDYRFSSMIELYERRQGTERRDVLGVIELGSAQSGFYGNSGRIDCRIVRPRVVEIERLHDKGKGTLQVAPGERILRTCGRYVFHHDFFHYLDMIRPGIEGEFDEVPVCQEIIRDRGALGYLIPTPLFDVGNPRGYLAANAYELRSHPG